MNPIRVSQVEFQRAFGLFTDKAKQEPVTITREGLDDLVVLSAEEYARLKRRDRLVGLTGDLPEEWIEPVREAKVPDDYAHLDAELK